MPGQDVNPTFMPQRALPTPVPDGIQQQLLRGGRYREQYVLSAIRKQYLLGDEGTYFVANNSGTGVATVAAPTAFSDTAPMFTLHNTSGSGDQNVARRVYIDWIR